MKLSFLGFKRAIKFFFQRITMGFDDSELWSLDITIAKFVLPRLKRFAKTKRSYPACYNEEEEWDGILNEMIYAMETILRDEQGDILMTNAEDKKVEAGLELFGKCFRNLWD